VKMSSVDDVYISKPARYILSIASIAIKKAEVLTATGLRSGTLHWKIPFSNVSLSTVSDRMNTHRLQSLKTAEIPTATDLKTHRMLPANIIFQCIAKYTLFLPSDFTKLSTNTLVKEETPVLG